MTLLLIAKGFYGTPMWVSIGVATVLATLIAITLVGNKIVQHYDEDLPIWKGGKKLKRMKFDASKTLSPDDHVQPPQ